MKDRRLMQKKKKKKKHFMSVVEEDGRVEGCVLIFSCENSKITTPC